MSAPRSSDLDAATLDRAERRHGIKLSGGYEVGGVIVSVDIVDCRRRTGSPWHVRGSVGSAMKRPRLLGFREYKGASRLFRPKLGAR